MTRPTSIRIPMDIWLWLSERADREGRTMSNLIVYLLGQIRLKEAESKIDSQIDSPARDQEQNDSSGGVQ